MITDLISAPNDPAVATTTNPVVPVTVRVVIAELICPVTVIFGVNGKTGEVFAAI
jgi:hypothetical protein